jgi:YD repeat-containing protein
MFMNTLSFAREVGEVPSQSGFFVFQNEPQVVNLGYDIPTPLATDTTVRDAGLFRFREGNANGITSHVELDEYGRPLCEVFLNADRDETTVRNWYYDENGGYEATLETESGRESEVDDVDTSLQRLDSGLLVFSKSGNFVRIEKIAEGKNTRFVATTDADEVYEEAIYGSDGNLLKITSPMASEPLLTEFAYDEHGRLIRKRVNRSGAEFGGRPQPRITEYSYSDDLSYSKTNAGGIDLGEETRHYDEKGRPVKIISVTGAIDLGRTSVTTEVQYPVLVEI